MLCTLAVESLLLNNGWFIHHASYNHTYVIKKLTKGHIVFVVITFLIYFFQFMLFIMSFSPLAFKSLCVRPINQISSLLLKKEDQYWFKWAHLLSMFPCCSSNQRFCTDVIGEISNPESFRICARVIAPLIFMYLFYSTT